MYQKNENQIGDYLVFYSENLGSGSFATVYGAKKISNNQLICVKIIRVNQTNQKLLERETEISNRLKVLDNPHLIKIYDITNQNNCLYIFMERCKQNLAEYITSYKKKNELLSLSEILNISKQIVEGYRDLYLHKIIHRDLKPENLLIGTDNKIKICDFGFGKIVNYDNPVAQSILGTPFYVSPQALITGQYSSKTDVYSFGMIVYFITFQNTYYKVKTINQLIQKILTLDKEFVIEEFKNKGSEQETALIKSILYGCIKFEEKDRFKWEDLFNIFYQTTPSKSQKKSRSSSKNNIDLRYKKNQSINNRTQSEEKVQKFELTNQLSNKKPPLQYTPKIQEKTIQSPVQTNQSQKKNDFLIRGRLIQKKKQSQPMIIDNQLQNNINEFNQKTSTSKTPDSKFPLNKSKSEKKKKSLSNTKVSEEKQNIFQIQKTQNLVKTKLQKVQRLNKKEDEIQSKGNQQQNQNTIQFKDQQLRQDFKEEQKEKTQTNENIKFVKKDQIFQQNYEAQKTILKKILLGIQRKIQLAENLLQQQTHFGQIQSNRGDIFRFLIINYQQSYLFNIISIKNNQINKQQFPLQKQLIEFIEPINYFLDEDLNQFIVKFEETYQKLKRKNSLITQQISDFWQRKEKYKLEMIFELVQTNLIQFNFEKILEAYRQQFYNLLEYKNYDFSKIKNKEYLKFLGYSIKFIQSESEYSVEQLKNIDIDQIPNIELDYGILKQWILENCKKNLNF